MARFGRASVVVLGLVLAGPAVGQLTNPVYTDDSPVARDTLSRIGEFVAAGNDGEAVRELQRLLDEHAERLVASPGDVHLFRSVRDRVHEALMAEPRILQKYRAAEATRAQHALDAGEVAAVERSRLMTAAGLEAALRTAQVRLEGGHFEGARIALEQLEKHPDRTPGSSQAKEAAAVLAVVAKYIDRPEVWERADRWAKEAGEQSVAREPAQKPAALRVPVTDFRGDAPRIEPEGVPAKPLWTVGLAPEPVPGGEGTPLPPPDEAGPALTDMWVLPTVVGDTVYINDGTYVTARDRFTLQPRWAIRPVSDFVGDDPYAARHSYGSGQIEDTTTVTVSGRLLVATMGAARNGDRDGEPGTFAIDSQNGQILWSAHLHRLDAQLDGASVRGPAMIEGDTVILMARKVAATRRMVSQYVLGLSAADGTLRWMRPIASAGSLVWGTRGDMRYTGATLHEGVVYCADSLGVIGAVEAATGRPQWVRRTPTPASLTGMGAEFVLPWQWSAPFVYKGSVFVLSPDKTGLLQMAAATGAIEARRSAGALGDPAYVLRIGDRYAAVGRELLLIGSLAELEKGVLRRSRGFEMGIRGRVVTSGEMLLVPQLRGAAVMDPAEPNRAPIVKLDRMGNILPLESQLLAVDGLKIHSYLTWNVAHALLGERMKANPDDPEPAITYAELAYRAGKHAEISPAADKALAAIQRAPGEEAMVQARRRLFTVLRDMVDWTQLAWEAPEKAPAAAPGVKAPEARQPSWRAQAQQNPKLETERPRLDMASMCDVIQRMGRAASGPEEQVSYFLALGRLEEAEGRAALASEAYQRVLMDSALAGSTWRAPRISVRAELEATRRVRQLLLDRGPEAYAAFEAQAAQELAAMRSKEDPTALEALARRFPGSTSAASAWARASELHDAAGQPRAAVSDLREGLVVAEATSGAGVAKDSQVLGEIAGRLVNRLRTAEQYFAAMQILTRLRSQYPTLTLLEKGAPVDVAAATTEIGEKLAAVERLPRIGGALSGEVQTLPGWSVMVPRSQGHAGRASEHIMLYAPSELKVALWAGAGAAGGGRAALQQVWSRTYEMVPPVVLRHEPEAVYLLWTRSPNNQGASIEKVSAVDGSTVYRTDPFRGLFAADAALQRRVDMMRNTIETPLDGAVRLMDVLTAMDEKAIYLVERTGRIAAFERETGKPLWTTTCGVSQVYDVAVTAGVLAIGGEAVQDDRQGPAGISPILAFLDSGTGQERARASDLKGQVRWIRAGTGPNQQPAFIAGTMPEVMSFNAASGKESWTITGGPAFASTEAWVFDDRIFLLDDKRDLWLIDGATGKAPTVPLESYGRLAGMGTLEGVRLDQDRFGFASDIGVCIFDRVGLLVGLDSMLDATADATLITPTPAELHYVAIETAPRQDLQQRITYRLHIVDNTSGMLRSSRALQLQAPPKRIAVLDGRIVLTAGNVTLVYEAPERDESKP